MTVFEYLAVLFSIIIGQLDGLLGVEVAAESAIASLLDVFGQIDRWHIATGVIGAAAIAALVVLERGFDRVPGAVVVVILGIAGAVVFDLAASGVAVVGDIPEGLPAPGIPDLSGTRWLELLGAATALLLVGFSEGYAAASAVACSAARCGNSLAISTRLSRTWSSPRTAASSQAFTMRK